MTFERTRTLAAIGGMVLVLGFAGLISLLNEGAIRFEWTHLALTLFVGAAIYLGWPRRGGGRQP